MSDIITAFRNRFKTPAQTLIRSPGRVNLIGEHTDYNDGFVLPMAIEAETQLAITPRQDSRICIESLYFKEYAEISLQDLNLQNSHQKADWREYVRGVSYVLQHHFQRPLLGFNATVSTNVPMGAGLSSSASFELALAKALAITNQLTWSPAQMAQLCQQAENKWVGVNCGIMDQLICASGVTGKACLIDCRTLEVEAVPLPTDTVIVILDTLTRRGLVESLYNERRQQCEEAAKILQKTALRDATLSDLNQAKAQLSAKAYQRAHHVITENDRTLSAAKAMKANDARKLGQLMIQSHESLRADFEVTNEALNQIVKVSLKAPGCLGARMTGAGFGGCAIALVSSPSQQEFVEAVKKGYQQQSGQMPLVYVTLPTAGCDSHSLLKSE